MSSSWCPCALALALLSSGVAAAQTRLGIFSEDSDRTFQVSLANPTGRPGQCTLPAPGWCRFALAPGPLQISIENDGRTRSEVFDLPAGDAALKLDHHGKITQWVGLALVGASLIEGAGDALGFFAGQALQQSLAQSNPNLQRNNDQSFSVALAVGEGILAGGVLIAGIVVAVVGHHRAGPTLELVDPGSVPPAMTPRAISASDVVMPAPVAPPPTEAPVAPPSSPPPLPPPAPDTRSDF